MVIGIDSVAVDDKYLRPGCAVTMSPPRGGKLWRFFQLANDLNEKKIDGEQRVSSNFGVGGPSNGKDQKWGLSHFLKAKFFLSYIWCYNINQGYDI